jgi:VanZ family protein
MSTLASNFPLPDPNPSRPSRWALVRAWLPTFIWMGVIACESTSLFTSTNTQGWLYRILIHINFWLAVHAPIINAVGRKVGHFVGYGLLGSFAFLGWTELFRYIRESHLASVGKFVRVARVWQLRAAGLAVLVTFTVASMDEYHQSFVPGRGPALHDVLLDTWGSVIAMALIYWIWKSRAKAHGPDASLSSELASEL